MLIDTYLLESLSIRKWMAEFVDVLKAYIFKSPSNKIETSSAISNASLSHHVPAREIPPPAAPSPTFRRSQLIRKTLVSLKLIEHVFVHVQFHRQESHIDICILPLKFIFKVLGIVHHDLCTVEQTAKIK